MYDPAVRRTPQEWCEQYGMVVLDPDGWRTPGAPAWSDPIGLSEFLERAKPSTTNGAATGAFDRIEADLRAYVPDTEPAAGVDPHTAAHAVAEPPGLAEILAANIARLRTQYPSINGMPVRLFAELIGVSKSTVSAWENGRQEVPVRRLPLIAQVLRVPISQLLTAPPDGVPPRPMRLGELREALVQVMDLEGCFGANMHESKDVLVYVDGAYLRLAHVQPAFRNGRFALVLVAGAHDPESGSPAWYAEHPEAADA